MANSNVKDFLSFAMPKLGNDEVTSSNKIASLASSLPSSTQQNSSKWYAGEQPTRMEFLGSITDIYNQDKEYGTYLYQQYNNLHTCGISMPTLRTVRSSSLRIWDLM